MPLDLRRRLYALQQRVAITNGEATALIVIVTILVAGGLIQHLHHPHVDVDPVVYSELDAMIAVGAQLPPPDPAADVVSSERIESSSAAGGGRSHSSGRLPPVRLDPNTASAAQLQRLPGIGPALAARIIEYREQLGRFDHARDLTRVRGIGPRTLERFEPFIVIEAGGTRQPSNEAAQSDGTSLAESTSGSEAPFDP